MADLSGLLKSDSRKAVCYCPYSLPAKITPKTFGGKLESCDVLRYESYSSLSPGSPGQWLKFRDMNRIVVKLLNIYSFPVYVILLAVRWFMCF
jgi:hypothetical protein